MILIIIGTISTITIFTLFFCTSGKQMTANGKKEKVIKKKGKKASKKTPVRSPSPVKSREKSKENTRSRSKESTSAGSKNTENSEKEKMKKSKAKAVKSTEDEAESQFIVNIKPKEMEEPKTDLDSHEDDGPSSTTNRTTSMEPTYNKPPSKIKPVENTVIDKSAQKRNAPSHEICRVQHSPKNNNKKESIRMYV
ncbi:unnamed protein product [Caenorhabditis angaria]|uniref:Uncharacterized protein n=1 Tax=Caenorhabditis angaria TaxID=860376 RepID=A0A9P1IA03_9PELO|nr:unnamed protein product [Caenorhabditis angaria]